MYFPTKSRLEAQEQSCELPGQPAAGKPSTTLCVIGHSGLSLHTACRISPVFPCLLNDHTLTPSPDRPTRSLLSQSAVSLVET